MSQLKEKVFAVAIIAALIAAPGFAQYYPLNLNITLSSVPVISQITVSPLRSTAVAINWTTNVNSDSSVSYGKTANYGLSYYKSALTTKHSVLLASLYSNTLYHYSISSGDSSGTIGFANDTTFTTPPVLVSGKITSTKSRTACAFCTVTATLNGVSNSTTTNKSGQFSMNIYTQVTTGKYLMSFTVTSGSQTWSYLKRTSIS